MVYYDNGRYSWEPGPNRSLKLSEVLRDATPGSEPLFTCYWGHTPTTPVGQAGGFGSAQEGLGTGMRWRAAVRAHGTMMRGAGLRVTQQVSHLHRRWLRWGHKESLCVSVYICMYVCMCVCMCVCVCVLTWATQVVVVPKRHPRDLPADLELVEGEVLDPVGGRQQQRPPPPRLQDVVFGEGRGGCAGGTPERTVR